MAGWGFAGRDRKSRPTWTQIASTSMPYAVTPRYQRASWPSIAHIVCIFSVDIIIIAITTHAIKIHSINIMMIAQIGFINNTASSTRLRFNTRLRCRESRRRRSPASVSTPASD